MDGTGALRCGGWCNSPSHYWLQLGRLGDWWYSFKISEKSSILAVGEALTPYCVAASKADPLSADVIAKLATASSYQKRAIIENAGWATPLGADKPNRALAESCLLSLDSKT